MLSRKHASVLFLLSLATSAKAQSSTSFLPSLAPPPPLRQSKTPNLNGRAPPRTPIPRGRSKAELLKDYRAKNGVFLVKSFFRLLILTTIFRPCTALRTAPSPRCAVSATRNFRKIYPILFSKGLEHRQYACFCWWFGAFNSTRLCCSLTLNLPTGIQYSSSNKSSHSFTIRSGIPLHPCRVICTRDWGSHSCWHDQAKPLPSSTSAAHTILPTDCHPWITDGFTYNTVRKGDIVRRCCPW